jgi:acetylornithine/succinyldiaminopimelate/putrescine aminotransferase/predicted amino acid dehydrogenase
VTRSQDPGDGGREAYARFLRPGLADQLRAIGMDVVYHRGQGDLLWYRDESGQEVVVLDLLGGFGSSLLGHNHPALVAAGRAVLDSNRPFHTQASARGEAGLLAARLSERVGRTTGREYVTTLANSGTEAVEAAIKHAEMAKAQRHDGILAAFRQKVRALRLRMREQTAFVPEGLFAEAARALGVIRVDSLDDLCGRVMRSILDAIDEPPTFFALEGAFHGKTTGSLKLTHNPDYRVPWRRIGVHTVFLPPDDLPALQRAVEQTRVRYLDLQIGANGALSVVEASFFNATACFVEPIQGEGGIREISPTYLQALRKAADEGQFPLVIDEIQSGMGRTGTFLASEPAGVPGDYYLLSKSLGGGLSKVAALLVERSRYIAEFGVLHTSTFADDDYSSAIAGKVLDLLEENDGEAIELCRQKGEYLLGRLENLKARYPQQLAEVRGRGLMIGFELASQRTSPSPLVRVLSEQNLLGFVISGHLLHEHHIRVAPTLSAHGTIRLQPSAFISTAQLDRFCDALETILQALRDGDAYGLTRYLVGQVAAGDREVKSPRPGRPVPPPLPSTDKPPRHVAFLAHFLEPGDVRGWEPTLAPLSDAECDRFLARTRSVLEPFVLDRAHLRSSTGDAVDVTVIGIPFTPGQVMEGLRSGQSEWALDLVKKGIERARHLGCTVVGFGGYTSIVTDNCRAIVEDEMALTSGNALAAAAGLEAMFLAAERRGIGPLRLGVVGAAGNIGAVLAEVASDRVSQLVLVGRKGAMGRLETAARDIYGAAWQRLRAEKEAGGICATIAAASGFAALVGQEGLSQADAGEALRRRLAQEMGPGAPIHVAAEMEALRSCNAILSATNSPRPVILPAHVTDGPVVLCDVAVPRDVDPAVHRERPSAVVLKGGMVRAPLGQDLGIAALKLEQGQVYGCLAETLILGLAGLREHFSYGKLTATNVRRIRELALAHGFSIEEQPERL